MPEGHRGTTDVMHKCSWPLVEKDMGETVDCDLTLVLIVRNQEATVGGVLESVLAQTVLPSSLVVVLDRCHDGSAEAVVAFERRYGQMFPIHVVERTGVEEGFFAGQARETGIEAAEGDGAARAFVFVDGDCRLSRSLLAKHQAALTDRSRPTISAGLRHNVRSGVGLELDSRTRYFGPARRRLLFASYTEGSFATWSCNLGINSQAIQILRTVNERISGAARVFNPELDGRWGAEDDFLGASLFKMGGDIVFLDRDAVVLHANHVSSATAADGVEQKRRYRALLDRLDEAIRSGAFGRRQCWINSLCDCTGAGFNILNDWDCLNFESVEGCEIGENVLATESSLLHAVYWKMEMVARSTLRVPDDLVMPVLRILLSRTRSAARCGPGPCCGHLEVARRMGFGLSVSYIRDAIRFWPYRDLSFTQLWSEGGWQQTNLK